jgi:hypothetical protein
VQPELAENGFHRESHRIPVAVFLLFKHHWLHHREPAGSAFARSLLLLLVSLGFLYGLARYLKKTPILRAE